MKNMEKNSSALSERSSSKKSHFPKTKAKVILCRCSVTRGENLFGIRIEQQKDAWLRTWAFKIEDEKARREGWDAEKIASSFFPAEGFNGCPYCGGFSLAQCACEKLFCFGKEESKQKNQAEKKCPWCGRVSLYQNAEELEVQGGGM